MGGPNKSVVNLYEAKSTLSRLVEQAARGEETIIAKAGRPMAKLVPFRAEPAPAKRDLANGGMIISYMSSDIDEPAWSDEELDEFGFS